MLHVKSRQGRKTFVIYDEKARHAGTDAAEALDTADTREEAFEVVKRFWPNAVIAEYEDDGSGKLTKEKLIN